MQSDNAGGWPDADKPGVPMNPERDGMHAIVIPGSLVPFCVRWRANDGEFFTMNTGSIVTDAVRAKARYVGIVLTPIEVAALKTERDALTAAGWQRVPKESVNE